MSNQTTEQAANEPPKNRYKAKIKANCFEFYFNIFADTYEEAQKIATKQVDALKRKKRLDKVQILGLECIQ